MKDFMVDEVSRMSCLIDFYFGVCKTRLVLGIDFMILGFEFDFDFD